MRSETSGLRAGAILGVLIPAAFSPAFAASDLEPAEILRRTSPAVVTVSISLRTEVQVSGQAQDEESRQEAVGVVVDPGGLVMLWNSEISSGRMMEAAREMGVLPGGFELNTIPSDFKVRFSGEEEVRAAFLAAIDSDLDLAFLQIEEVQEGGFPAVDLNAAVAPRVGEEIVSVSRLQQNFDFAPYFETARVSGVIEKPRKSWALDRPVSGVGLPFFRADGKPVGVVSTVLSTVGDERAGGGSLSAVFATLIRRTSLGPIGIFLLPAGEVQRAVERSKVAARELLEEREKQESEEEGGDASEGSG